MILQWQWQLKNKYSIIVLNEIYFLSQSEEIVKSVYDIPWYNLTVKEQLMLKLLLQYVQNTITITLLGGRKLNVQTGCDVCLLYINYISGNKFNKSFQIYKTIYSTYVMMEQFYFN